MRAMCYILNVVIKVDGPLVEMYTLRTARDRLGLTQKEAAKKLGISDDVLSNYERGKTYPNVPMLKKIEEVYQVEYDQLLFLEKDNA